MEVVGEVAQREAGRGGDAREAAGQVEGGQEDAVLRDVRGVVVVADGHREDQAHPAELVRRPDASPDQGEVLLDRAVAVQDTGLQGAARGAGEEVREGGEQIVGRGRGDRVRFRVPGVGGGVGEQEQQVADREFRP